MSSFVNGLGGAFVFSDDPERLSSWYTDHLGLTFEGSAEFGAFYRRFLSLDPDDPARRLDTTFAIMQAKATFPPPVPHEGETTYGDQPFMVNLRVDDLEALLTHLASKGVAVLDRQDEPYGRFAWVRDGDGNRLELYEPIPFDPAGGDL